MTDEHIFSVSEFLGYANELLETRDVQVEGEVIKANYHPTGLYLTIKDPKAEAVLECYASPYTHRNLGLAIERGMLVRVGGLPNIYVKQGSFRLKLETIELAGEGALKKAYEALKKKLQEEGLFDRKRALPQFVSRIGLITSKTGAVIGDLRHNLSQLGMSVLHYDVRVQGAQAAGQIRGALEWFNRNSGRIDVLVIIRGGGSESDLDVFNDEGVVRGVFGSRVPTLVSIGHDRDVPLAQLAADASASTPTGAAHAINDTWSSLTADVPMLASRLLHAYGSALASSGADARSLTHRLAVHLARLSGRGTQLQAQFMGGIERLGERIRVIRDQVDVASSRLTASSPERLLGLGYSIVTDDSGAVIRSVAGIRKGQRLRTRVARGIFTSSVEDVSLEP